MSATGRAAAIRILPAGLIVLVAALVYSNTLSSPFLFDDFRNIVDNHAIRNLDNLWPPSALSPTRHVGYASFAVNYRLGGLDVFGYHLTNLLIHIGAALLLYRLVLLLYRTPAMSGSRTAPRATALLAALLFVAHPLQTQAVTYIVQRFASLAAFFYLLSLVLYLEARLRAGGRAAAPLGFYAASIAAALLAMKTKEISLTLPAAVVLVDILFFPGPMVSRKRTALLLPFLLLLAVIPLSLAGGGGGGGGPGGWMEDLSGAARETRSLSRGVYLVTELRVMLTYIRLLFLPTGQNLDYDFPLARSPFDPPSMAGLAAVFLLLAGAVALAGRARRAGGGDILIVSFGILFFFLALSVESSIIPIRDVIFEHRLYLPLAGAAIAFAAAVASLLAGPVGHRLPRGSFPAVAALLVLPLGMAAHLRNEVWKSEIVLWEDVVAKSPAKARPRNNLGNAYYKADRMEEAIREYEAAIGIDPDYVAARTNLGAAYGATGRVDDAVGELEAAVRLDPRSWRTRYNLGMALEKAGHAGRAREEYEACLAIDPDFRKARDRLLALSAEAGGAEAGAAGGEAIAAPDPDRAGSRNERGMALAAEGRTAAAIDEFRAALRLDARHVAARYNLATALQESGDLDEARREYEKVIDLDPAFAPARNNLGALLRSVGRLEEAAASFRAAVGADPGYLGARLNLVSTLAALDRGDEAMAECDRAIRRFPDSAEAKELRRRLERAF